MIEIVSTTNAEIARVFDQMAGILEMEGGSGFKARAYRRGSLTIRELPTSLESMVKDSVNLENVSGIGKAIAAKIKELLTTGRVQAYERLKAPHFPLTLALLDIPGVGGVTTMRLLRDTGVTTASELIAVLDSGAIAWLPKTGERSAAVIVAHLQEGIPTETASDPEPATAKP
jgi:DNA polymerase (family 10)